VGEMKYDNSTNWGNGPRKVVRDYLDHWYNSPIVLENTFGLDKMYDRFFLIEELNQYDEIEEDSNECNSLQELYCRELVRDYLNNYKVSEKELMDYFNLVKINNHYYLKEELKYTK
jgi:hypothetical protein